MSTGQNEEDRRMNEECKYKAKYLADELDKLYFDETDKGHKRFDDYIKSAIKDLGCDVIVDMTCGYHSCRVYFTVNGPTVWVDTETHNAECNWSPYKAHWGLSDEVENRIDDIVCAIFKRNYDRRV